MKKIYLNTLTPEEIIKRLKNGEVVHIDGTDRNSYKMIDGILCSCFDNKAYLLGVGFDIEDDVHYFEEPGEFKVEKTGLYKTRDGRVTYVSSIKNICNNSYPVVGVILGDVETSTWNIEGKLYEEQENCADLVEYIGD